MQPCTLKNETKGVPSALNCDAKGSQPSSRVWQVGGEHVCNCQEATGSKPHGWNLSEETGLIPHLYKICQDVSTVAEWTNNILFGDAWSDECKVCTSQVFQFEAGDAVLQS